MSPKSVVVRTQVSVEEHRMFETEALRNGLRLSDWIHKTLLSQLRVMPEVAVRAFEHPSTGGKLELPAFRLPEPEVASNPVFTLPKHPCLYLLDKQMGVFGPTESQGTCQAPTQRGKPCQWGPGTARACPAFRVSRVADQSKARRLVSR